MSRESSIPQDLMMGTLLHFENGVPINDLSIREEQKRRLARVHHVYLQWVRNPFLDVFPLFKQLIRQGDKKYADLQSEWHAAQKDKWLFDFVVENVGDNSRKVDEARVRAAANHVIQMGMETDNGRDIIEGAKLLAKVAHLDQPEGETVDMSKVMFLPPLVTTSAHELDDTKQDYDDKQSLAIMNKYGAHIDEKRKAIEERVEVMLAAREASEEKEPTD